MSRHPLMSWPLVVLSVCAATIGIVLDQTWSGQPRHLLAGFLGHTPSLAGGAVAATRHPFAFHAEVAAASAAIALGGIALATYFYLRSRREIEWVRAALDFQTVSRALDVESVARWKQQRWIVAVERVAQRVGLGGPVAFLGHLILLVVLVLAAPLLLGNFVSPYKLSYGKFFMDEFYLVSIVLPLRGLAWFCDCADRWLIDGTVNGIGRLPPAAGRLMRSLQMGIVPFYALAMVFGTLILLVAQLIWAG